MALNSLIPCSFHENIVFFTLNNSIVSTCESEILTVEGKGNVFPLKLSI